MCSWINSIKGKPFLPSEWNKFDLQGMSKPKWHKDILSFNFKKKSNVDSERLPLYKKIIIKINKGLQKKNPETTAQSQTIGEQDNFLRTSKKPDLKHFPLAKQVSSSETSSLNSKLPNQAFQSPFPLKRKALSKEAQASVDYHNYSQYIQSSLPEGLLPRPKRTLSPIEESECTTRLKSAQIDIPELNQLSANQRKYELLRNKPATHLDISEREFIRNHEESASHIIQSYQLTENSKTLDCSALGFGEKIQKGLICVRDKNMEGLSSRAILVDWENDPALLHNLNRIERILADSPAKDALSQWRLILNHVNQTFPIDSKSTRAIITNLPHNQQYLLGGFIQEGVGACLERALLTKLIADRVGLEATLERGVLNGRANHAWNTVKGENNQVYLCDTLGKKPLEPMTKELEKLYVPGMSLERYIALLNHDLKHIDLDTLIRMRILDLEVRNGQNLTFLMSAAHHGRSDVVEALLKAGKDPRVKDHNGWTALDMVEEEKNELLLQGGNTHDLEQVTQIEQMLRTRMAEFHT